MSIVQPPSYDIMVGKVYINNNNNSSSTKENSLVIKSVTEIAGKNCYNIRLNKCILYLLYLA